MMNYDTLKKWGKKIVFSISDQGVVSLANFVLNIYLANFFSKDDYGAFAFGFAAFLFFSGFHNALILEPLTIFESTHQKKNPDSYITNMIVLNFLVSGGLMIIGCVIGLACLGFSPPIFWGILGASISAPFILSFWFIRRFCYLQARPDIALVGSILYAVTLLGVFLLQILSLLTVFSTFIWLGFSSLVSFILISLALQKRLALRLAKTLSLREIWNENWQYGKWVVGSAVVFWLGNTLTIPALGIVLGLSESGIFRALQNLIMPLQQVGTALGALFTPWLSMQLISMPFGRFRKKAYFLLSGYLVSGMIFFVFLLQFGQPLIKLLYRDNTYLTYGSLLIYLGLFALLDYVSGAIANVLRVFQNSAAVFRSQAGGAFVSVTLNLVLIYKLGIYGAGLGLVLTGLVVFALLAVEFVRSFNHNGPKPLA